MPGQITTSAPVSYVEGPSIISNMKCSNQSFPLLKPNLHHEEMLWVHYSLVSASPVNSHLLNVASCVSASCPESPQVPSAASWISVAPSDSVVSWHVTSVLGPLSRSADGAPSIDKQQTGTVPLLIHGAEEPGQCKVDGTVSRRSGGAYSCSQ